MHVCLSANQANRMGGADVYTEELALGLAARGHEVTVVCHDASPEVERHCRVIRHPLENGHLPVLWRFAPLFRSILLRWRLRRLAIPRPDIVICSRFDLFADFVERFPQTPRIYLPHAKIVPLEFSVNCQRGMQSATSRYVSHFQERQAILHADSVVRMTRGNILAHQRYYRLPQRIRFDWIPPGIRIPKVQHRAPRNGPLKLLSVGRLVETKNLRFALECLAKLRDRDWHFDVVGDGLERESLTRMTLESGIAHRVTFHGHSEETRRFYESADLFLFPSRLESFGLVLVEAMAHGLPALAIRSDGNGYNNANDEIIRPAVDGILCAGEVDFFHQLESLLADPSPLARLGKEAIQRVREEFDWERTLDRWESLLHELSRGRSCLTSG